MNSWLPPPATDHGLLVEIGRGACAAFAVLALFLGAERWKRRDAPPVEWTRKLVHVGAALIAATFPWLFASSITVFCLAALFAGVMGVTRRRRMFGSFHCVERRSEGGFYFLVAVCVLFVVGREQPVFYLISLLVLMLADSSAALVGVAYGRRRYSVETDERSLEGSLVFLAVAFLSVCVPLLIWTDLDRGVAVLVSLQLAVLVTCVEAVSTRGIDNLLVPLATFYLLVRMTVLSAGWIALLLGVEFVILALLIFVNSRSRLLTTSGVIAAHLFFFAIWAMAEPAWLLAPALALAAFIVVRLRSGLTAGEPVTERHQVFAVLYTGLASGVLFVADNGLQTIMPVPEWLRSGHVFYVPFVGAMTGQSAILLMLQSGRGNGSSALGHPVAAGALSLAVVCPVSLWLGPGGLNVAALAAVAIICIGAAMLYAWGRRRDWGSCHVLADLRLQAASVAIATLVALPVHFWWNGHH